MFRRRAEAKEPALPELALEEDDANVWESIPDPAGDALDEVWQREWEENLVKAALRRIRPKVSAQQLMIFELAALGEVPLKQVARKLGVSLMQVARGGGGTEPREGNPTEGAGADLDGVFLVRQSGTVRRPGGILRARLPRALAAGSRHERQSTAAR